MTPNRQAAVHRLQATRRLLRREPGDHHAEEMSRQAERALRAANREHDEGRITRELAAIEEAPQASMNLLYSYLERDRRTTEQVRDGPSMREWEETLRPISGRPPQLLPLEEGEAPLVGPTAAQMQGYARMLTRRSATGPDGLDNELITFAPPRFSRSCSASRT